MLLQVPASVCKMNPRGTGGRRLGLKLGLFLTLVCVWSGPCNFRTPPLRRWQIDQLPSLLHAFVCPAINPVPQVICHSSTHLLATRGHQRHCSPAAARHETSKSTANAAISENDEYSDALGFVGRKEMRRNLDKLEPRRRSDRDKTLALTATGFYSFP